MHALFLLGYLVLPLVALWRSRSVAWTVIVTLASVSIVGVVVNFLVDHVTLLTWPQLQWLLLLALAVPAAVAVLRRPPAIAPRRQQLLAIGVPVMGLGVFLALATTRWTEQPAYLTPVNFLMGHALAEDNAKWLDFAAFLASGMPIDQSVPMGGPLQLFLVFVATLMAVVSQLSLGGVNEVMVAGNTAIYGQFILVALAPLALAPLAEARLRRPVATGQAGRIRLPWPLVWVGALVLVAATLMATAYGHLTLQWTMIVTALWASAYLVRSSAPRAQLLTSLTVAAGMTVWLPMNAIAAVLVLGWLVVLVAGIVRKGRSGADWVGLALTAVVAASIAEPLRSSVAFVLESGPASAAGLVDAVGGMGGGVRAAVGIIAPAFAPVLTGLTESTLFSAGGGTEVPTALLAGLAALGAVAAALVGSRQGIDRGYVRLLPLGLLTGFALALNALDQWATGTAPHYGSLKFTFMAVIVIAAVTLPVGLLLLDPMARGMTPARWAGVGAVVLVLVVDSLLIRSIAAARPQQWSPEVPFDNARSYWWPADVDGSAEQPIADNPVACVYLPQGAKTPSAILESQLSDPQRVYSCSRLLAGLAGEDAGAQPIVDWLRREWLTNTRAWENVHGYLSAMPDSVLDRPVILLDDGSNVIGLESMRALLARYPAEAGQLW